MKLIIELNNGIELTNSNIIDFEKIKKIYLTDEKNRYGFFRDGKFFINRYTFDFKIDIANFDMKLLNNTTGCLVLGTNSHNYIYNIGYELVNETEKFIYKLMINKEIYFSAQHYKNDELINNKKIKLQ